MAAFDKIRFATHLRTNAVPPYGVGKCALHVRLALRAAGITPASHPVYAKNWGPTLEAQGFEQLTPGATYVAEKGDVAVIQATSVANAGHIQGYDGKNWTSDFIQTAFWPGPSYRNEEPEYVIYRRTD